MIPTGTGVPEETEPLLVFLMPSSSLQTILFFLVHAFLTLLRFLSAYLVFQVVFAHAPPLK